MILSASHRITPGTLPFFDVFSTHDTRYSWMRSAAFRCFLQERFSKIAVTFQEKTHTFLGFWKVAGTQWEVVARSAMQNFGKVA